VNGLRHRDRSGVSGRGGSRKRFGRILHARAFRRVSRFQRWGHLLSLICHQRMGRCRSP
jgi:hypothetical protein